MRKRTINKRYTYGPLVLQEETQVFKIDLYKRIGLEKIFNKKKVLDLGCGHGTDSIILARFAKQIVGVDITRYKEWEILKSKNISYMKVTKKKLPFKDNEFDGVYMKDVLHHVRGEVSTILDEVKRVTKKNGSVVILEGNRYNPIFYIYVTKLMGHDHFTQREFSNLINSKFKVSKITPLEAYPPFRFPMPIYRYILKIEKELNKIIFFKPFFAYNIAIIKNDK